jgi:hypothetical protein
MATINRCIPHATIGRFHNVLTDLSTSAVSLVASIEDCNQRDSAKKDLKVVRRPSKLMANTQQHSEGQDS